MQDDGSNLWLGAGLSLEHDLDPRWFVEASLMPGFCSSDMPDFDLGSDFAIRSLLGLGIRIGAANSLSVAIDHRSNANAAKATPA